jgi:hypothetical protein
MRDIEHFLKHIIESSDRGVDFTMQHREVPAVRLLPTLVHLRNLAQYALNDLARRDWDRP